MRTISTLVLGGLMALGSACAPADPHAPPAPDPAEEARERLNATDGGRLVLKAIEAHGGLDAWHAAETSSYTWEYANEGGNTQFKTFLVADNRSRLIYHDILTMGPFGAPEPAEGQMAWNGEEAWIAPASIESINPRFWSSTGYYFEQIPFVLADPGLTYEALPRDSLDGQAYDMVRVGFGAGIGDAPGDTYTLYLDQATGVVAAIRYTVTFGRGTDSTRPLRETLFRYEDLVTVDGLTVPQRFRGYWFEDGRQGAFKNEAWADSISFRRPFDRSKLEKPEDAKVAPAPGA